MKRDLRGNLAAKAVAVILLFLSALGVLTGCGIVIAQSYGYGVYDDFQDDPLFQDTMEGAMRLARDFVVNPNSYNTDQLRVRYAGFAAQVYDGEPLAENLIGSWSEVPNDIMLQYTAVFASSEAGSGYYTVVGYLDSILPASSVFERDFQVYTFLHSFSYSSTFLLTVFLAIAALVLLVFLLSAAGHRAGQTGIYPNWQDRIPLDLYLICAGILFTVSMVLIDESVNSGGYVPLVMAGTPLVLSLLAAGSVVLAALLTIATRLKLGKWWRNTACYWLTRWCWRIWKHCWGFVQEFIHILPMTWRTVMVVGSVLLGQIILTLLMFENYNGGFFFLVTLVWNAVLVAGAAWLAHQLQQVQDIGKALAAGDLEAKLDTSKLFWDIKSHAECLNDIGEGMNEAVERRMRSERLKTELITNVSHDIKTPLTSIVNYVDLLKKEDLPPSAAEYVTVLDRQSHRLKKLTEDLVEASKASTGNVPVHLEPIVVNEIIHQAIGDYDERLTAGKLEVIVNTYEGNLIALTDGRLLWRVLDNLLSNVCKYAMAGTRVYVDLGTKDSAVLLTMKNISRDPLNINAGELMERFVRGDASRHTEGSGLGLNIARSLMDLMGGSFNLSVDGDLFKAELTLKMVAQMPWEKPIELALTAKDV